MMVVCTVKAVCSDGCLYSLGRFVVMVVCTIMNGL